MCIVTLIVIRDRSCQRQTCDDEDDNNDDDDDGDDDDDNDIGYWAMTMIMTMILSLIMIRDRSCHRQTLQTKSLISEANYFCDKSSATKFQLHILIILMLKLRCDAYICMYNCTCIWPLILKLSNWKVAYTGHITLGAGVTEANVYQMYQVHQCTKCTGHITLGAGVT